MITMKQKVKNLILYSMACFCLSASLHGAEAKKAIVIGASSGMGREVAKLLAADGYTVGLLREDFLCCKRYRKISQRQHISNKLMLLNQMKLHKN